MITSYLQGGLGNQMFQISAACSLAWDNDDEACFDLSKSTCPLQGRVANNYKDSVHYRLNKAKSLEIECIYREPTQDFMKIPYKKNTILVGYFQSEKYFAKHSQKIREMFSPKKEITEHILNKYGLALQEYKTSIHVRHGDYWKYKDTHPPCDIEYYNKAISMFPPEEKFLVISDSMDWCRENFIGDRFYFSDSSEEKDYIDFYLMSMCDNNIIANSSFSWWAAWMNSNVNKRVIYPKRWFGEKVNYSTKDLTPTSWEVVE